MNIEAMELEPNLDNETLDFVENVMFNEFNGKEDKELEGRCVNCSKYGNEDSVCSESGLVVEKTDCCWMFEDRIK